MPETEPCGVRYWTDPIYGAKFTLIVSSWKGFDDWMVRKYNCYEQRDLEGASAVTSVSSGNVIIWFLPEVLRGDTEAISMVTHEAFHATSQVLQFRGMKLGQASEEAYSYHLAWVVRTILKHLNRLKNTPGLTM